MTGQSGRLVVISGPPGAGKSTVARLLADRYDPSALVEGDAFFAFLARGAIEPWLPESNEQNEVVTRAAGSSRNPWSVRVSTPCRHRSSEGNSTT